MFDSRTDAAQKLAEALSKYKNKNIIVLAIPRGGVVVGKVIAENLNAKLDLIIPRKIGSPSDPEFAIGAVAEDGTLVIDKDVVKEYGISESYIKETAEKEIGEIRRRMKKYKGSSKKTVLKDKIVILADDGIATGKTMEAALLSVKKSKPAKTIVAVPVLPFDSLDRIREKADELVFLEAPKSFYAIGMFYSDFPQVTDEEVIKLLKK